MSYNNSQESTINTQDISKGFIEFLMNGELDEMVSLITYNIYIYILKMINFVAIKYTETGLLQ